MDAIHEDPRHIILSRDQTLGDLSHFVMKSVTLRTLKDINDLYQGEVLLVCFDKSGFSYELCNF